MASPLVNADHQVRLQGVAGGTASARCKVALIETMRLEPSGALVDEELHLARLARSARALGLFCPLSLIRRRLREYARKLRAPCIVRLELDSDGRFALGHRALPPVSSAPLPVALAEIFTHPADWLLRHKTTRRKFLDAARERAAKRLGAREVLFRNIRGELTEGSFTNLFVRMPGEDALLTPPVSRGLLPGILRQRLLAEGKTREAVLTLSDLRAAEAFYMGNSVRGLMPARLVS